MKKWHWALLALFTGLSLFVELALTGHKGHHWWSSIPAFFIFFGFLGCCLIGVIAKFLGKWILQRREDYYDDR